MKIYTSIEEFYQREESDNKEEIREKVLAILKKVKEQGDAALFQYTEQFDQVRLNGLRVFESDIERSVEQEEIEFIFALETAAQKIKQYHQKQKRESWFTTEEDGTILGQKIMPIERVGIYVPGGTAAYPSSVLMNAIPAMVAGVNEIVMVTPPNKEGKVHTHILVAAKLLGIKEIYAVGGAQAIAALAYGTETIRPVDKIVGPGNIFVATAKKEVFGTVGIDMVAGPSEIVVVADDGANPTYIAADLLSQAEHDVMAASILVTNSKRLADEVEIEVERQLALLPRKEIAEQAIKNYGGILITNSIEESFDIVNQLAPEHLEVMVEEPFQYIGKIKHAGAIFLGPYSSEPVGDYLAGPNHVLPTNQTARFSSPLSVDDFVKKSSIISYSKAALLENGQKIVTIAEKEGLQAHANAIKIRLKEEK